MTTTNTQHPTPNTQSLTLIADSGSTKTEWTLIDNTGHILYQHLSEGINPTLLPDEEINTRLANTAKSIQQTTATRHPSPTTIDIMFYGSGITPSQSGRMTTLLKQAFSHVSHQIACQACSDIIAAARATCGKQPGIACILGTGSNSCLYDGSEIIQQTPSLGYILGDEGGGAYMGKQLLNIIYKGRTSANLKQMFEDECQLHVEDIINNVYRKPMPNTFLASLTHFIRKHIDEFDELRNLVAKSFYTFLTHNILPYHHSELPVHTIGSIPIAFNQQWTHAIHQLGLQQGKMQQTPTTGLIEYHTRL